MKITNIIGLCIAILLATTSGYAAGGTITGKVQLSGAVPAAKKISVVQDTSVCGAEKVLEDVQVGPDKGIYYAVVRVLGVKAAAAPAATANVVIDQKGCMFTPRVVVVPKGGSLDIGNADGKQGT